jgi:hypothetical protein
MTTRPRNASPRAESALRVRIKELMPNIVDVIKPANKMIGVGPEGDVRPRAIAIIRSIHAIMPADRDEERKRHREVKALVERLQEAAADMPEYARYDKALKQMLEDSKASAKGRRIEARQNLASARMVYDLLLDGGFGAPTLHQDGQYVITTALMIEAATGREISTFTLSQGACKEHFDEHQAEHLYGVPEENLEAYKTDNPFPYFKKKGSRRRAAPLGNTELDRLMLAIDEDYRRQREEAARSYPALDELLDEQGIT